MGPPDSSPDDVTDVVVEVTVSGGPPAVEMAAADLWAAGATAVEEREGEAVTLAASFPTPGSARAVAAEVGGTVVEITDISWRDRWKDFAQPVEIGHALVVAPAWREVTVPASPPGALAVPAPRARWRRGPDQPLIIRIDPGPCFGSGTHPSTRLVLRQLMDLAATPNSLRDRPPHRGFDRARSYGAGGVAGWRVLDVGCGSGILSVTAALLGATVTAVDVDPDAVRYSESNAAANGVADLVSASTRTVEEVGDGFDLALVNVTAGVHALLGPSTAAVVRSGATLLLAGLLPGQWRHVAGAYPGTTVVDRPVLDGWEGVVLTKDS
jgi:ribosomal protein L11 methylase PrmA